MADDDEHDDTEAGDGMSETDDAAALDAALQAPESLPAEKPARKLTFKKRVTNASAALLGKVLLRTFGMTWRFQLMMDGQTYRPGDEVPVLGGFRGDGGPLLFALWHGSCLPLLYYWRGHGMCVVTSRSAAGQLLARLLRGLGYTTVTGSSSRGGARALINMTRAVREGVDATIAVDGPRGPLFVAKPGIVLLAKMTGRPILPIASCAARMRRFKSWDRFRLPSLFTRVTLSAAAPIHVPPDADHETVEAKRIELEQTLRRLQTETDAFVKPKIKGFKGE